MDSFATKELYDVCLKATSNIEIGEKSFSPGETVLRFEDLQLSVLNEQKIVATSRGGYSNSVQIRWEDTQSVDFVCEKGVASKLSMAIMSNSKLFDGVTNSTISYTEVKEADEEGKITLKFTPLSTEFFIYDSNGEIPTRYLTTDNVISGLAVLTTYTIQYLFTYTGEASVLNIGQRLFNGYMQLTAKMRLKDDTTGNTTTGILIIPHVRLVSDLSMRLGSNAIPLVSTFRLQGDPVGERKNSYVCQLVYLDTDIDSDI